MDNCPTQAVLPLVGLAAEKVIRDQYNGPRDKPVAFAPGKALFQNVQRKCERPQVSVSCP
ncbi:MAG: hypothetical protein ACQESR_16265 [Planctomycetota bacterium]